MKMVSIFSVYFDLLSALTTKNFAEGMKIVSFFKQSQISDYIIIFLPNQKKSDSNFLKSPFVCHSFHFGLPQSNYFHFPKIRIDFHSIFYCI